MKSPTIFILFLLSAFYTSLLPSATAQVVLDTEAATGKERRPLTVVQSPNPFDKGIGTIISSPYRSYFIGESFPVNMTFGNFAVILPCVPLRSEWTVVNGQPEGPAPERSTCQHIGIHVDDENHARLVLTNDDPLEVKFEKDNHFWPQNNLVLPRSE
ncbi:Trypsin inhibitor A [Glycine soja]|uniref:Trypsin inhibitor A n=1 Tax=Glycine soja TaxID=3848 RepID=A0A0B2P2H6_GLYSO|nr:Trypsin inhibitor A [Glycine soja]